MKNYKAKIDEVKAKGGAFFMRAYTEGKDTVSLAYDIYKFEDGTASAVRQHGKEVTMENYPNTGEAYDAVMNVIRDESGISYGTF